LRQRGKDRNLVGLLKAKLPITKQTQKLHKWNEDRAKQEFSMLSERQLLSQAANSLNQAKKSNKVQEMIYLRQRRLLKTWLVMPAQAK